MPQPIDLHTELSRVDSVERVQQVADRLSLAAQQRRQLQSESQQHSMETAVQQSDETDGEHIDPDRGRQEERRRRANRKKQAESRAESDEHVVDLTGEGGNLDVRV